jgi:hypothetical protein
MLVSYMLLNFETQLRSRDVQIEMIKLLTNRVQPLDADRIRILGLLGPDRRMVAMNQSCRSAKQRKDSNHASSCMLVHQS